jgi:hypothetical protein
MQHKLKWLACNKPAKEKGEFIMPVLRRFSFKWAQNFVILLLIGVLFLTSSSSANAQGQTTNPLARHLPAKGLIPSIRQAEPAAGALTTPNLIRDHSFEASYVSQTYWGQYSENFGTPLCTTADCGNGAGTVGPRTGNVWAWFGGVDFTDPDSINPEGAQIYQYVNIPSCGATLKFYLWIGAADTGSDTEDFFVVSLNGTRLFLANATQKNSYPSYKLVTVNINPGTFTPGDQNILYFGSVVSDQLVSFNLDDVTLIPNCLIITGNAGVENVTINYPGGSTTTTNRGNYSFPVAAGWSGTVTPSKVGYTFSPPSRTYTNVISSQTGQDYTAIPIMHSISGNVGVAGATLLYMSVSGMESVTSQSDGTYSFNVQEPWTGTVMPGHACFTFDPTLKNYSAVSSNQTAQDYTPTFVADSGCADTDAKIGGINQGRFGLSARASTRVSFTGVNSGPVQIRSTNSVPLLGAERVIYKVNGVNTSFTEMMALPDKQLDNMYWLPWYNNVDLDTQLRFANVSGSTATVHVFIGETEVTPAEGITLQPGASTRVSYAGVNDGPVQIVSTQNIVAAERVIYKINNIYTSFSEMMALPDSQLDTTYWLPWYNNVDLDTQLRIANVSDQPATVTVTIGDTEMTPIELAAGASTRVSYAGVNDGPVQIVSTQNIVAAERVIYKINNVNTSFTEMMALPAKQLDTTYWLPWYNNVDLDTQLRFANVSDQTATVHVYIGGQEMGTGFTLQPGESTRQSFAGINAGPVQIVSTQNIVASERVIYRINQVNTSFSEMMGLPNSQLDITYWLPWYNNVDLDTQLRFGVP